MASLGNTADFGDLTEAKSTAGSLSNRTRGIVGGGNTPSDSNVIEYFTIASAGNAIDFGDLTDARQAVGGGSSSTRGIFSGF